MTDDETTDGQRAESVTAGLPSFDSYYTDAEGRPVNTALLYGSFMCQECETLKSDVVGYTLPLIILHPRAMQWDHLVKCRRCIRLHILSRLWLAVLLAHVLSPFIIAWWVVVFAQTFFRNPA